MIDYDLSVLLFESSIEMTKTICLTGFWICTFAFVNAFAMDRSDELDSRLGDEVIAYFESHLTSLPVQETPSLLRVAYLRGQHELCEQYFRSLPTAGIESAIYYVIDEGTIRGDLDYVEFVWRSFGNELPQDEFALYVVSSLSNFGFYSTAVEFIERHITDDRLRALLLRRLASDAFLAGHNARLKEVLDKMDDDNFRALESLPEELRDRRASIISIAKYTDNLGIPTNWDELLRVYRLDRISPPENDVEFRERLANASESVKLCLWFIRGATAAKKRQFDTVHECILEATEIAKNDKILIRIWRPEFLYLASVSEDFEFIRSVAGACADSGKTCCEIIAALITTNMHVELLQYLDSITLTAAGANVCIEFLEKQSSINLADLLSKLTNQATRIQLLARWLDPIGNRSRCL